MESQEGHRRSPIAIAALIQATACKLWHLRKHGIHFEEAMTIFGDPHELMISDPDHSEDEIRNISIGESDRKRILLTVYTQVGNVIRLISAREAESDEIVEYLERRGAEDNA